MPLSYTLGVAKAPDSKGKAGSQRAAREHASTGRPDGSNIAFALTNHDRESAAWMSRMYQDPASFVEYWLGFRARTTRLLELLGPEDLEWTHAPGRFTFGDVFRHLAGIERFMYAETVHGRQSAYPGHGAELAAGIDAVRCYVERNHAEAVAMFRNLSQERWQSKCSTPAGKPITVWKWLRAMVEHEAHHRGQLYLMAGMRDIATPPLFGLTEEEVRSRSRSVDRPTA
jgi:uncharacterized damage-inducible protein DinB